MRAAPGAEEFILGDVDALGVAEELAADKAKLAAALEAARAKTVAAALSMATAASSRSSSSDAPAPSGAPRFVKRVLGLVDIKLARTWMPPQHNLGYEARFSRYVVSSRHLAHRKSRAYGPVTGETEWSALKFVLTVAWASWKRVSGENCPWQWE